jgi:hypothetical protein
MAMLNCFFFYSVEVLATLTSDVGRILSKLHRVQPQGTINLLTGIRIAHVSWKLQLTFELSVSYKRCRIVSLAEWLLAS